jgi:hypothetical protein
MSVTSSKSSAWGKDLPQAAPSFSSENNDLKNSNTAFLLQNYLIDLIYFTGKGHKDEICEWNMT